LLAEKGWEEGRVASAMADLRRRLMEDSERQPHPSPGLQARAVAMVREVWEIDPCAELLVLEKLVFSTLRASFDQYPIDKVCPQTDSGWYERIKPNIRYGIGESS
jgi:hypothetical protein